MKAILLLLLAFLAIAHCTSQHNLRKGYGDVCSREVCAKDGEECGYLDFGNDQHYTGCRNSFEFHCNISVSGEEYAQGTCLKSLTVGQSCVPGGTSCQAGLYCTRVVDAMDLTYVCTVDPIKNLTANAGQFCVRDGDCEDFYDVASFDAQHSCISGRCKFIADNQACDSFNQCNYDTSNCHRNDDGTSVCRAGVALGGFCNTTGTDATLLCQRRNNYIDLNCMPNAVDSTVGKCQEIYSQKEDQPCTEDKDCKDGVCASKTHADYKYGVCVDYRKTSTLNKECIDDNDCTASNGESCRCGTNGESKCTNYNLERETFKTNLDYEECERNSRQGCLSQPTSAAYEKCINEQCKKSLCKLYRDIRDNFSGTSSCDLVYLCDASALFASLPLLALAVFVMLFQ